MIWKPKIKRSAGRPTKAFKDSLKPGTPLDYERLVNACVEAILNDVTGVAVQLPVTFRMADDFPMPIKTTRIDKNYDLKVISAKRLLKWLNAHGHTDINSITLRGCTIMMGKSLGRAYSFLDLDNLEIEDLYE